jgi:hypothetical protein
MDALAATENGDKAVHTLKYLVRFHLSASQSPQIGGRKPCNLTDLFRFRHIIDKTDLKTSFFLSNLLRPDCS